MKESWLRSYELGRAHGLSDGDAIAQATTGGGSAGDPDRHRDCPRCGGRGWVYVDAIRSPKTRDCPACKGSGERSYREGGAA